MAEAKPSPRVPSAGRRHIRRDAVAKKGRIQGLTQAESLREQQVGLRQL